MECESHVLVIKPLIFMYIVTDSQARDSRGCQVEELKRVELYYCKFSSVKQTKAPGTTRLEWK